MIQAGVCLDMTANAFIKHAYLARENSCWLSSSVYSLLLSSGRLLSSAKSSEQAVSGLPGKSGSWFSCVKQRENAYALRATAPDAAKHCKDCETKDIPGCSNLLHSPLALYLQLGK